MKMKQTLADKKRLLESLKDERRTGSNRPGLYVEIKMLAAQVVRGLEKR